MEIIADGQKIFVFKLPSVIFAIADRIYNLQWKMKYIAALF
jgi:hypothetical protein